MILNLQLPDSGIASFSAVRLLLNGGVQGCGLRPRLVRLATAKGWGGFCRNTSEGVEVLFSYVSLTIPEVLRTLEEILPAGYRIASSQMILNPSSEMQSSFRIDESPQCELTTAQLPVDVAVCDGCLKESRDPFNRRHGYWLLTCARCGPRYSALKVMPFDRERTTLECFPLCPDCRGEYERPDDRRFHAQTISCASCGPRLWCVPSRGEHLETPDVVSQTIAVLERGGIVAARGVGGYQLWVDATNQAAVERLRERKQRPEKPLAVMCENIEQTSQIATFDDLEREVLVSPANPIVLLARRQIFPLAAAVCHGVGTVGVILPTTAFHAEVLRRIQKPLVVTSGNLEGDPLAVDLQEAEQKLRTVADLFVHHDRPISQPLDDSVVRVMAGRTVTIRAARGFAPLPLPLTDIPSFLALGSHQKNAVAVSNGWQAVLAPHAGDLDSEASRSRWRERLDALRQLYGVDAEQFAVDQHPDYYPTQWSEASTGSAARVWHHHAHVVAGMVEQAWLDREVLGVAFDGTGSGPDGSIWGGEFLRTRVDDFERVGCIHPFQIIGADLAARQLFRSVIAVCSQLRDVPWERIRERLHVPRNRWDPLMQLRLSTLGSTTSSCGRLFDAAAAIILGREQVQSEGYAATCLESICSSTVSGQYSFEIMEGAIMELDWRPAFEQLLADLVEDASPAEMATRFHRGLADGIVKTCLRFDLPVILSGGVFQNRFLVEAVAERWPRSASPLGLPGRIPPNDGGLAVGQLAIAASLFHLDKGS